MIARIFRGFRTGMARGSRPAGMLVGVIADDWPDVLTLFEGNRTIRLS